MITRGQIGKMNISNDSSLHLPVLTLQEITEFGSLGNDSNLSASITASKPAINMTQVKFKKIIASPVLPRTLKFRNGLELISGPTFMETAT